MGISAATWGTISLVGVGMSAYGAYTGAEAQKQTLDYEAGVARNNQILSEYQASQALQVGEQEEEAQRLRVASTMGEQRAALAASGVDLGTGSAAEVLASTKFMGERDALTIRDNAARRAWALREQGKGYAAEAAMAKASGDAISPLMSTATSLLGGGTKVAAQWYRYKQTTDGTAD